MDSLEASRKQRTVPAMGPTDNGDQDADVDDGYYAFIEASRQNLQHDQAAHRRIRRKADAIIMPLICAIYALQFLDRTSLSYASVMGLLEDLDLHGKGYSWLGSAFFISFLIAETISGRAVQRYSLGKYMGICAILWGVSCSAFAAVHNFREALALRILLGVFEASISPGLLLIISQWYKKSEQGPRTGIWVSFNGYAQIFGGLTAYGIAHSRYREHFTLAPWRIVFIMNGCLSIAVGILFFIFIPRNPLHAWWLSPHDRIAAVARVQSNHQGIGTTKFKPYQVKEAFLDPFTLGIFLMAVMGDIPNGGLVNYFSQIIVSFGYTPLQSLLYSSAAGAVAIVGIMAWSILSYVFGHRLLWGLGAALVSLIGTAILTFAPSHMRLSRLFGYYLTAVFPAALASVLSLISSNVAGYTKKSTVAAIFYVGYCIGNIIGPQTFQADQQPEYRSGEITVLTCMVACCLDLICIYAYLSWQNKRREHRGASEYDGVEASDFMDLTDKENPDFKYAL